MQKTPHSKRYRGLQSIFNLEADYFAASAADRPAEMPRMEASSSSTIWKAGMALRPRRRRPFMQLQQAAGIGGEHGLRAGCSRFSTLRSPSCFAVSGCEQVVDAGRAAAERASGISATSSPGMPAQQVARLLAHTLRVLQMAGIVIGDAQLERMAWRSGSSSHRISEMSLHLAENAAARAAQSRIVAQQIAVLLHRRSAAGGVDDDGVDIRAASKAAIIFFASAMASLPVRSGP